jgi:hypothetical protein
MKISGGTLFVAVALVLAIVVGGGRWCQYF